MPINDLIDYICRSDLDFQARIEGATADEIGKLEHLIARPFPETYKRFLSFMGHNDGGLNIGIDSSTDIRDVIDQYENYILIGEDTVPSNCISVGVVGVSIDKICLQLKICINLAV